METKSTDDSKDADENEAPLFEIVKGGNSAPAETESEGKTESLTGKRKLPSEIDAESAADKPPEKISKVD